MGYPLFVLDDEWFGGAEVLNPTAGLTIASTGPLDKGRWHVTVLLKSTVDAKLDIQHRDTANTAIVTDRNGNPQAFTIELLAKLTQQTFSFFFSNRQGERISVISPAAITGTVQASIFAEKVHTDKS